MTFDWYLLYQALGAVGLLVHHLVLTCFHLVPLEGTVRRWAVLFLLFAGLDAPNCLPKPLVGCLICVSFELFFFANFLIFSSLQCSSESRFHVRRRICEVSAAAVESSEASLTIPENNA